MFYTDEIILIAKDHIRKGTKPGLNYPAKDVYNIVRFNLNNRRERLKNIRRYYDLSMDGFSNDQIIRRMGISVHTAKMYHKCIRYGKCIEKYSASFELEGMTEWTIPICTLLNGNLKTAPNFSG